MVLRNFIVFEGGDGSGTTTQINLLKERLENFPRLHATFEPTDRGFIRRALKGEIKLEPDTLAVLFAADRTEHLYEKNGIIERLERGELVVCDRYVLSSLVYQGITCGRELPLSLNKHFPHPELLFFFDVEAETAVKRMENRAVKEIFEYQDFQKRVREEYKALLPWYEEKGVKIVVINAGKSIEESFEAVWTEIKKLPILKEL
jgi:dTMP kinase